MFCSLFAAAAESLGVAFAALLSAFLTKSSAEAPSKTGMLLIVIAMVF